jgi:SAM-dependent methyltransferase
VGDQAPLEVNRANWDERVPAHLAAYRVDDFVADRERLSAVVREDLRLLGPFLPQNTPAGLDLVHLQCHIGLDTLSWARLGARVTGVDFSPASIEAAEEITHRTGLDATFVVCDVAAAAEAVGREFDVVYTGTGALCWLPDLTAWAVVVAALLRPGGVFFVRDAHPILNCIDYDSSGDELHLGEPYFDSGPMRSESGTTYADATVELTNAITYQWQHSVSDIVQALLDAGLHLVSLGEHRTIHWQAVKHLVPVPGGWALPKDTDRLPLTLSVVATKPR